MRAGRPSAQHPRVDRLSRALPPLLCALGLAFAHGRALASGGDALPGDLGDLRLGALILEHDWRWLRGDPLDRRLFSPPWFWPHEGTLAYSENLLGALPPYAALRACGLEPYAALALWYPLWSLLSFAGFHLFARALGLSRAGAAAGAFLFAFGLPRGAQLAQHCQLIPHVATPLFAWALLRGRPLFAGVAFAWQAACSIYLGFFLALGSALALGAALALPASRTPLLAHLRARWPSHLAGLALAALLLAPIAMPYLSASKELQGGHSPAYIAAFLPRPASWAFPAEHTLLYRALLPLGERLPNPHEQALFAGLLPPLALLALLTLAALRRLPQTLPPSTLTPSTPEPTPSTPEPAPSPELARSPARSPATLPSHPLDPRPLGVGRRVADPLAWDLDGAPRRLSSLLGPRATVVAALSTTCPLSRKLAPALARLEREYVPRGVAFVLLSVDAADTAETCRAFRAQHGLAGSLLLDRNDEWAGALGIATTTEAFLLDAARTLVYRGAVNDQYGVDFALPAARHEYLRLALEAALAGGRPEVRATSAPGCAREPRASALAATRPAAPTWHGRVSRIVAESCLECHRAGGVGPFPLETYAQAAAKARTIAEVVEARLMPPWPAAAPAPGEASPWANDRSLCEEDRAALLAWVAAGKPEGDPAEAPLPRRFSEGWSIGEPDVIVDLPEPMPVRAEGTMPYFHIRVPTGFTEDRWVQAIEVSPTALEVVHHVLVFTVPPAAPGEGRRPRLDETGGFFAAYAPGMEAIVYPEGTAKRLPAGTDLFFQLHYTPNGRAQYDRTRVGIVFAKSPPERIVRVTGIAQRELRIPPGARDHEETASITMPADARILALLPHMHVRGAAFRFDALPPAPGGPRATLLEVPRWDFDWQLRYEFREPPLLRRGTVVFASGTYDNSERNPVNPDPSKSVKWGPQTEDEMMLGYLEYVLEKEDPAIPEKGAGRGRKRVLR